MVFVITGPYFISCLPFPAVIKLLMLAHRKTPRGSKTKQRKNNAILGLGNSSFALSEYLSVNRHSSKQGKKTHLSSASKFLLAVQSFEIQMCSSQNNHVYSSTEKKATFVHAHPCCRFLCFHLRLEPDGVEDIVVGEVPASAGGTKRVNRSARHGDVVAVELANHVHASGIGISGLEVLWLVDLRIHHVIRGHLASGHADARSGLVVHHAIERVVTWHHHGLRATVVVQNHGVSRRDASTAAHATEVASHWHHHTRSSVGIAASSDRANATSVHHGLGSLIALLDGHGDHGGSDRASLKRTSDTLGSLYEDSS